jgi:uncharacterized protein YlxW (UPF0749 family)
VTKAELEAELAKAREKVASLESECDEYREDAEDARGVLRERQENDARLIHETIRELGMWPSSADVPWAATTTDQRMMIEEAKRRAENGI